MNALRSERGSIVLGGLTKLLMIAALAALAVVAYDCAAIGYTQYSATDHGAVAADAAGERWRATHDITQAYDVAQQKLTPTGETINPKTFSIGADDTVQLRHQVHGVDPARPAPVLHPALHGPRRPHPDHVHRALTAVTETQRPEPESAPVQTPLATPSRSVRRRLLVAPLAAVVVAVLITPAHADPADLAAAKARARQLAAQVDQLQIKVEIAGERLAGAQDQLGHDRVPGGHGERTARSAVDRSPGQPCGDERTGPRAVHGRRTGRSLRERRSTEVPSPTCSPAWTPSAGSSSGTARP